MATWKRIFLTIAGLLLVMGTLAGCGVPEEEYNKVKSNLEATRIELSQATYELTQRNAEVQQLENELTSLRNLHNLLRDELALLKNQYKRLQTELEQSLAVPYTAISGRELTWAWKDMDGDIHKWTLSVDAYRSWIEKPKPHKTLSLSSDGKTYRVEDFRPYVLTEGFTKVVPSLYQESADEWVFAQEAFNLVTQLTVYSKEIGEVPRWPVETLTEAGGDCEDLAILFASLLKAAPYPYELSLVYMDIDNPTDSQDVNHVIVWVETDDWKVFVDCTSKQGWNYYENVVGWYYEL